MIRSRERLACATLLMSFALCLVTAVGVPLGVRYFVRNSMVNQWTVLEQRRGTLRVQRGGQGEVIALVGRADGVTRGTVVDTGAADQGALTVYTPGEESIVAAEVQIYADTSITLLSAQSPRFSSSPLPHTLALEVADGRVRVNVSSAQGRPTVMELRTPDLVATLSEGSYEIRVRPDLSELAVRQGEAQVSNLSGESVTVGPSQRTLARASSTSLQSLPGERNLLTNGQFDLPLEQGWRSYHSGVQQEPAGSVIATDSGGRSVAYFQRSGIGHVEVGIRQEVAYDVRDFSLLTLHLNVQVQYQSLAGCGSLGSECPVMVRIDYEDIYGTDRQWYHGFYALDAASSDLLPEWLEQVPLQTWFAYDSGNLIELFDEPPAQIRTVTIYASGHSFASFVTDAELLAQE
jgi:hypothetical protein